MNSNRRKQQTNHKDQAPSLEGNSYVYSYIATNPYIYKCKNHFIEMKGDVGMSLHEKERNKKNLHQADNPSLHLCLKIND